MREAPDVAWSPYMEQTLRQFLGNHAHAQRFDFTAIECRTSFCEITAVGFDATTEPVWAQVMFDIRQQPWSEFGQYGTSMGLQDGRPVYTGTLYRRNPR